MSNITERAKELQRLIESSADFRYGEKDEETSEVIGGLLAEIERLEAWVSDLQSGGYINCVYCGHRYEPGTPAVMADVLKTHVETCKKHPMSAMKAALDRYRYAFVFAAGEDWDGGLDMRARFSWARAMDVTIMSNDELAAIGKQYLDWEGGNDRERLR